MDSLQRGPYMKLKFSARINHREFQTTGNNTYNTHNNTFRSAEKIFQGIDITGLAKINYRLHAYRLPSGLLMFEASISMMTPLPTRQYQVTLNIVAKDCSKQFECSHSFTSWIVTHSHKLDSVSFTVELELMASKSEIVTFAKLYDDTEVADFSLTTAQGSVLVHKACLAAHSDFFKAMLSKDWEETGKNEVELKDVALTTLEQLKKYFYLGILPESLRDLGSMFVAARCYLIESLKEKCITKMVSAVTTENLYEIIEFACENNVPDLVIVLLQHAKDYIVYGAQKKPEQKVVK